MVGSLPRGYRGEIQLFANRFTVPAVIGGVLSSDGLLKADVVGIRRRGTSDLATLQDKWHIGSCGKSITAALYAKLVEQGEASWGVPVSELFPDLIDQINPAWANRTIDEVFHCRSGMKANPSLSQMKAGWVDSRPPTEQRTDLVVSALSRAPKRRGRFIYSNLGYVVIGAAIDRLAGMPYEQALQIYILEPLGITSLGFGPPPKVWGHRPLVQLASVCLFKGKPANPVGTRSDNPRVLSSAGTMHITLEDWAKFHLLFLMEGGNLLQPETIKYLLEVPPGRGTPMAMGWARVRGLGEIASFGMQGSNTMWAAAALMDKNQERTSLVVCNDGRSRVVTSSAVLAARLLEV